MFTWPDHSTTLMELCQLLYSLVQTPSPTLLLLLTFLWPGVVLSALATARVVLSVCRSTSRAGLSLLASGSTVFRDLVQIILLLSSFTVSPHIISLSNYFSSACQAVFIRRVFLSARLAFGLLIFEVWYLAQHFIRSNSLWFLWKFSFFSFSLFSFSSQLFLCKCTLRFATHSMWWHLKLPNLSCYFQVANSIVLPSPRHSGCQWSLLHSF